MGAQYAVIVAGGSGSRMGSQIPKQFMLLGDQPVLMHTLWAFRKYSPQLQIILVLPESQISYWKQLCQEYQFAVLHTVVPGGKSRTDSVHNGLKSIKSEQGTVAIHDGVRPFVTIPMIQRSFEVAVERGSAVAAVKLKDSIRRRISGEKTIAENRDHFSLIQTPQTFDLSLLRKAYQHIREGDELSDDASVVEALGHDIHLIEGDYRNIKITTPEDIIIAEAFLAEAS